MSARWSSSWPPSRQICPSNRGNSTRPRTRKRGYWTLCAARGLESSNSPVPVEGLNGVIQLAAGETAVCAIGQAGEVTCWGLDYVGQLSDGVPSGVFEPAEVAYPFGP